MLFRKLGIKILTFCLIATIYSTGLVASTVQFIEDQQLSTTTGYSLLKWELAAGHAAEPTTFVLQQSEDPNFSSFETLYEGPDLASFVSGLSNGEYFYRVGTKNQSSEVSQWSKPLKLEVTHHSRKMALSLFITGIVIFLATTGVIVVGNLKYNK